MSAICGHTVSTPVAFRTPGHKICCCKNPADHDGDHECSCAVRWYYRPAPRKETTGG